MAKKDDDTPLSFEERQLRIQERQLELAEQQAAHQEKVLAVQTAQLKQTAKRNNEVPPRISAFNPRGEKDFPMAQLKCDIYAPWKLSPMLHSLDREEVDLFNLLEPGDDYKVELNDGSVKAVVVLGVRNQNTDALESLRFVGPKDDTGADGPLWTNENRQQWPSLKVMLRQMLGEAADAVLTMRAEVAQIKAGDLSVSVGA